MASYAKWLTLSVEEWGVVSSKARGADRRALRCVCLESDLGVRHSDVYIAKAAHPELNDEQMAVFQSVALYRLSAYLTGAAGCGKTHTIKRAVEFMHSEGVSVKIAAPTACAAQRASTKNVVGLTLHILFCIKSVKRSWGDTPVRIVSDNEDVVREQDEAPPRVTGEFPTACIRQSTSKDLSSVGCFIIDEVSMCDTDFIDLIHATLARVRGNTIAAFGGAQIVFMGDFAQLPPIKPYPRPDRKIFAFEHETFKAMKVLVLKKVMRQKDVKFSEVLSRMRDGTVTEADCQWIRSNASKRGAPSQFSLFSSNSKTNERNKAFYDMNPNPEVVLQPRRICIIGTFKDPDVSSLVNPDTVAGNVVRYPAVKPLHLKVGCRVVCTRNIYSGSPIPKFRNGQFGVVDSIEDDKEVWVRFDGTQEAVEMPRGWICRSQTFRMETVNGSKKVTAACKYVPLALAWACTIHKAQGDSIDDDVDIDPWSYIPTTTGSAKVQEGSAYTAMSRPTDLSRVRLLGKQLRPWAFQCNPRVRAYYKELFG